MIKRIIDIIISVLGIITLSPLFILIAIIIKAESRGPVLFRQKRVGKNEKIFKIDKFRTMTDKAWQKGTHITISEKDPRITKIGKFLRKYKIDELPQLFNIIKGDMSLVGPRPEIPEYVDIYTPEQKKVLSVKPGITDLASIKYINENKILSKSKDWKNSYINKIMPDKLKINLEYIKKKSLFLDFYIIFKTILNVSKR